MVSSGSTRRQGSEHRRHIARAAPLVLGAFMLYGCAGGLSCGGASSCLNGYAYPQTQAQVANGVQAVDDGVRMRMTQAGLDFLSAHMRDILVGALGGSGDRVEMDLGNFTITEGSVTVRVGQGEAESYPTTLFIDASDLSDALTFEFVGDTGGDDGIRIRAVDVPIGIDARVFGDWGFGNAACDAFGTNADYGGYPWLTGITFEVLVHPNVGTGGQCDLGQGECILIAVDVVELDISPRGTIGSGAVEIDTAPYCPGGVADGFGGCSEDCSDTRVPGFDPNGDAECSAACNITDLGIDLAAGLVGVFEQVLAPLMDEAFELAIGQVLADIDGSPLSASNRFDMASFAPGLLSPTTLDLGYSISPTGNAFDVNCPAGDCAATKGMDIILKSGFEAAPDPAGETPVPHPCALPYRGAEFNALYGMTAGEFETNSAEQLTGELGGDPYHLGASLAEPAVNQMLYGAYNAGALCLELTTEGVHGLTRGAFTLSAGTIDLLTGGKLRQFAQPTAPSIVAINPLQPPVISYGEGSLDEGHIMVDWPDVEVSFYVLMYERYARIFGVSANVSMQLSVFNDPDTRTLHVSVVQGPTVDGFVETYNELLPGVDFTGVLESLLGLAFDTALGDGLEFDYDVANALSTSLGVPLYIDFRGIETVPPTGREFLNVYLELTDTPPQPFTAPLAPIRLADEPGLYGTVAPLGLGDRDDARSKHVTATGSVRLVGDDLPLDPGSEYFALVDFGAWRGPLRLDEDGGLVVTDGKLALVGDHVVKLRARLIGEPNSLVPFEDAVEVYVWTDPEAPHVSLDVDATHVRATGVDVGTGPGALAWSWRLDDGDWSAFSDEASVALSDLDGARRVSARAMDLAGNVSAATTLDVGAAKALLAKRGVTFAGSGGCSSSGSASALGALGLLLLGLRRRRLRR